MKAKANKISTWCIFVTWTVAVSTLIVFASMVSKINKTHRHTYTDRLRGLMYVNLS